MIPLSDPECLLYKLDLLGRRALFVRLSAEERRSATFLDERLLAGRSDGGWLSLDELLRVPTTHTKLSFIWHIGHCGSTLLSQLLQHWPALQVLREPLALRSLAEAQAELGSALARISPEQFESLSAVALTLLARPTAATERSLIKATSSCNGLIEAVMQVAADSRSLLLDVGLEVYLATILKAPASVHDALSFAPQRLRFLRGLGSAAELFALQTAEIVAMGWLAERLRFAGLLSGAHSARLLAVDFDRFLAAPESALAAIARHFGLNPALAAAAVEAPAAARYAKLPSHQYSAQDRQHDLARSRQLHATEIAAGRRWVEQEIERVADFAQPYVLAGIA